MNFKLRLFTSALLLSLLGTTSCGVKGPPVPPANTEITPWAEEYQTTPDLVLTKERLDQLKQQLRTLLNSVSPTPGTLCSEPTSRQKIENQKRDLCAEFKIQFQKLNQQAQEVVITNQLPTMPRDALKAPYEEMELFCRTFQYQIVRLPPECGQ